MFKDCVPDSLGSWSISKYDIILLSIWSFFLLLAGLPRLFQIYNELVSNDESVINPHPICFKSETQKLDGQHIYIYTYIYILDWIWIHYTLRRCSCDSSFQTHQWLISLKFPVKLPACNILANTGSGIALVPYGNKPLSESMSIVIYVAIWKKHMCDICMIVYMLPSSL